MAAQSSVEAVVAGREVTFYIPDAQQVALFRDADPDRDWALFNTGVHVWVGQTYLRLKRAGHPVALSATAPAAGIVVTHADHVAALLCARSLWSNLLVVAARADRPQQRLADVEVVQNAGSADGERVIHLQHWPQPGLAPREPGRGSTVANVAFKGTVGEMTPEFAAPEWAASLREQGMEWRCDAVAWGGNTASYATSWNDYSEIDVVVAMRKDTSHLYLKKPASKLVNAWLAGVPAILGPEQAYRELRRSELDYIEVGSAAEAAAALARLKSDPALYRAMADNGLRRADEVGAEACTRRWATLLFETLPRRRRSAPLALASLAWRSLRCRAARLARRDR